MKLWKKALSLLLALVLVLGVLPFQLLSAKANALSPTDPSFSRVFHLDAGRKYYSLASLKKFVDMAARNGYNQFNLYLSDSQGLRVKLDDMTVTTSKGTYDLSACVGDGLPGNENFMPCGTDGADSTGYLTQAQLAELVSYAKNKGVAICPTINTPAHMGAILQDLTLNGAAVDLRADTWGSGAEAVALNNEESMTFLTEMTKMFVDAFAKIGCKYYCIGADEYMSGYSGAAGFDRFVTYVNEVGAYIKSKGMTPRMFNDAFTTGTSWTGISKDYEIYYWAKLTPREVPQVLADAGYKLINMPENLYFVLRNDHTNGWWLGYPTVSRIQSEFDVYKFSDSNNSWKNGWSYIGVTGAAQANVVGAAFAIWSDNGSTWTTDDILSRTDELSAALAKKAGYTGEVIEPDPTEGTEDTEPNPDFPEIEYNYKNGGVSFTMVPGQTSRQFTIKTQRQLTAQDFAGLSASVNIVKQVKTTTGNANSSASSKVSSIAVGDTVIIGDGTYYLTCDGTNLGVTKDQSQAARWTAESPAWGQGCVSLKCSGKYLSATESSVKLASGNTGGDTIWKLESGSLRQGTWPNQYISISSNAVKPSRSSTATCVYGEPAQTIYTTTVTFTAKDEGQVRCSVSDTLEVDGKAQSSYFFDITVRSAGSTDPTEPETEPTEPETKPTEPETKPTEPETKPTEPETKPTEPETKPTEPETKPTEPETKPTEPETKPTEPETKPTEPETKPTEPETKPTEPETKPTEPETEPTEPTEPDDKNQWSADKVYTTGNTVTYNGKTYKAKWWTRGEVPGSSNVWELVTSGSGEGGPTGNDWSASKAYGGGSIVTYQGKTYKAQWWTMGETPGKSMVWVLV